MNTTLNHSWVRNDNEWNMYSHNGQILGTVLEEPTGCFCVIKWSQFDNCETDLGYHDNLTEAQFQLYQECLIEAQGWDRLAAEVFAAQQDFEEPKPRMNVLQAMVVGGFIGCGVIVAVIWGTVWLLSRVVS
jgi:hypothetical protein